jgi:hypothetical protein
MSESWDFASARFDDRRTTREGLALNLFGAAKIRCDVEFNPAPQPPPGNNAQVPSFVPKWRAGQDKTANTYVIEIAV